MYKYHGRITARYRFFGSPVEKKLRHGGMKRGGLPTKQTELPAIGRHVTRVRVDLTSAKFVVGIARAFAEAIDIYPSGSKTVRDRSKIFLPTKAVERIS